MGTTQTSRLSLLKPDTSENVAVATQLNDNWDALDAAAGFTYVTSTTRPSGFNGQAIYESDTGRYLVYDSGGWHIIGGIVFAWTPTYTNITVGNGTVSAFYQLVGEFCEWHWRLVWGSTTSFSSTPGFQLPITGSSSYGTQDVVGSCFMYDSSVGSTSRQGGSVVYSSSDYIFFTSDDAAGRTVTASVPFTWTSGDIISACGRTRIL